MLEGKHSFLNWYFGKNVGSRNAHLVNSNHSYVKVRGGEISKMYTCPRTTGCKKALVCTKALLARTQINTGKICQQLFIECT